MSSFGILTVKSVEYSSLHRLVELCENALPRHIFIFSPDVYARHCIAGKKTPVIIDFMQY
jgi:hypothetical protein